MKRKIKLIASTLALSLAVTIFAFGVYALAVSRGVNISGRINFVSTATKAEISVYVAEPYEADGTPSFSVLNDFYHEFSTGTGDDAEKKLDLEEIDLNDITPNFAFKIVVKSLETSRYLDLNINALEIVNAEAVSISLNLEQYEEVDESLKPEETRSFIYEYKVDGSLGESITELFGVNVALTQGFAYTPINQESVGVTPDLTFELIDGTETARITGGGTISDGNLVLPDYYLDGDNEYKITEIGNSAFYGKAISKVELPTFLLTIGIDALGTFEESGNLTSVVIPSGVTTIGIGAFSTRNLTSVIIPDGVSRIEGVTFYNNNLTRVIIPNGVTLIKNESFGVNNLISVVIPSTVTEIQNNAFADNNLTSVVIPSSVTTMGYKVFGNNIELKSVTFEGTTPPTIGTAPDGGGFFANHHSELKIYVPVDSIGAYKIHENLTEYAERILAIS